MLERINSIIWGKGLIILLISTGMIYTFKLGIVQFRLFPYIFRKLKTSVNKSSQFRTFCMSLGTAMGTGNITGVASAINIGGAGAVFWMWVSAFTGMALVYAENCLSAKYSNKHIRGPMAYIRFGVGSVRLSLAFASCCLLVSIGMGGMVQVSEIAVNIKKCVEIDPLILFFAFSAIIYIIISGGACRIGKISQFLLPSAAMIYTVLCLYSIISSRGKLTGVIYDIFSEAFGFKQAAGGISGYCVSKAISAGIRRGVFSNEAGLGSSPILHSSAENYSSFQALGMCGMLEVFVDTFLCCTLTALTILCSTDDMTVFSAFLPVAGEKTDILLALLITVFAFCTVIGWSYCGMTAFIYIFSKNTKLFALLFSVAASSGALFRSDTVWTISDIFNGLMAFVNIFALLYLINETETE